MALEGKNADYLICVCKKKTLGEVREFIRANHITDLKTLCEKADIGNKCGACREMLDELLQTEMQGECRQFRLTSYYFRRKSAKKISQLTKNS